MGADRLRVIAGQAVQAVDVVGPEQFQAECVESFVASWTARGFSETTIANDAGVLERMLDALDRPAWEVTATDVDRVVGALAASGRAVSTRRNYVQVFKGFHRFLEVRKAAEIEAAFGVRRRCRSGWPPSSSSSRGGSPRPASMVPLLATTRCFARCITPGCGPRK